MTSNEYIMTSLRTTEGCDLAFVENNFGIAAAKKLLQANSERYLNNNEMNLDDKKLTLTREGKLLADGIASALFF